MCEFIYIDAYTTCMHMHTYTHIYNVYIRLFISYIDLYTYTRH